MGWRAVAGLVGSIVGGAMSSSGSSSKEKSGSSPASWGNFPDLEVFWDKYIDMFWGMPAKERDNLVYLKKRLEQRTHDSRWRRENRPNENWHEWDEEIVELEKEIAELETTATFSYCDMIEADHEWITNAYIQQDATLTQLENTHKAEMAAHEKQYMENIEGGAEQFEGGMKDSSVGMLSPGGQMVTMTPRSAQRTLEAMRDNRNIVAESRLGVGKSQTGRELTAGQSQAQRDLVIGVADTPHATDLAYMDYLKTLGMAGQSFRTGHAQIETTKKEGGDVLAGILAGTNMGMNAYSAYNA